MWTGAHKTTKTQTCNLSLIIFKGLKNKNHNNDNYYENMPMQYTEFFEGMIFFFLKIFTFLDIFLIIAQNIDREYTLEMPRRVVLMSTHNLCFGAKIRKIGIPLYTPILLKQKWDIRGYSLHRYVFLMY